MTNIQYNGSNILVIDLEIQDPILQQSDWDHTENIKISCCVVYSYMEDRYHVYGPNDIDYLRNLLICADLVVGYNINKFDLPVIFKMENRRCPAGIKTYDILAEIWKSQNLDPLEFTNGHRGYSLDKVAGATLNKRKTGSGAAAPFIFKQGNIWKVIDYCINDVAITKELFDYLCQNSELFTPHKCMRIVLPQNLRINPSCRYAELTMEKEIGYQ
jgi:hypothetical protein